ncbi:MAG TPA: tRNA preQ1(34) S-adenosylmethionine ribosyltransferase-isomerase QueA [Kofleriaceae bacterium]|nr:tRNA preQ1(34) S-adenosylmethionine ribosyltransferase-isomerase QueA [Kofleriaceae bacterium]
MRRKRDYAYELPPERIAQAPAGARDGSRLLAVGGAGLRDHRFDEIAGLLPEGAVLVLNDTQVIPARLHARKDTGGAVELLLADPVPAPDPSEAWWRCLARPAKGLRQDARLTLERPGGAPGDEVVRVVSERDEDGTVVIGFARAPAALAPVLESYGEMPLPPYIERPHGPGADDLARYQTVYAREPGAVAAPTAGLHFTPALIAAIEARGVSIARLTLHVGLGTFAPMRVDDLDQHRMHVERYIIPEATAALVGSGRPVVAVGTTCVRALEASAAAHGAVRPGPASTDLFIRPGFRFRVVDHLVTNFHVPESTLLVLVCAFAGYDRMMAAYHHAIGAGYRFFSYGDAMLASRGDPS